MEVIRWVLVAGTGRQQGLPNEVLLLAAPWLSRALDWWWVAGRARRLRSHLSLTI